MSLATGLTFSRKGIKPTMKKSILFISIIYMTILISGCSDKPPPNLVFTPADVSGRAIGVLYGSPSIVLAEELGAAFEFRTGQELIAQLKIGSLDCAIMENSAAAELVSATSGIRILDEPLLRYDMSFAVARENAQLLRAVDTALLALRENGTLKGLLDRCFAGKSYTYVRPVDVTPHPGVLTLAISPENPPFSYKDSDGNFTGLDIDIARAVCDILGIELSILEFDARDLVKAVWVGQADLALGWIPVEGEETIAVSEAYASSTHVVVVRR